jgi:hypothetical protein
MLIDIHDIPKFSDPVNQDIWLTKLAQGISLTAKYREESYVAPSVDPNFRGYRMSLEAAALAATKDSGKEMMLLVIKQLKRSWNDALDFAKEHGFDG